MPISPIPTIPVRNSETFNAEAEALVASLPTFVAEVNALEADVIAIEASVSADAANVVADKSLAEAAAADAQAYALSALTAVNAPGTNATSTTSLAIGTGSKSLTIEAGKYLVPGMFLMIANTATPANYMTGQVTTYDAFTGALVVNVSGSGGSGTFAAWSISLSSGASTGLPSQATYGGKVLKTDGTTASWQLAIADQSAANGKFLTSNGTSESWASPFPSQSGNNGKALMTDGTSVSWGSVLPSQSGNNGKFLATDGTSASWSAAAGAAISYSARTSNTILAAGDKGKLINYTSGAFTQTFPAAATLADGWYVYLKNSGTGIITLDPNGSETIDGQTTIILNPGDSRLISTNGTAFFTAQGVYANNVLTRTSNTILGVLDKGAFLDITSGTFTQTFAAAATLGQNWYVYIKNAGSGTITLNPNGSETIDGIGSIDMAPGEMRLIVCTGATFFTAMYGNTTANTSQYLKVVDSKTNGTDGGSSSSGNNTRTLNTTITNTIGGASLSANNITLPAGTYDIRASAHAVGGGKALLSIYDTANLAYLCIGIGLFATTTGVILTASGRFTLGGSSQIELRHYSQSGYATYGFGQAISAGLSEIYAQVEIWKVS